MKNFIREITVAAVIKNETVTKDGVVLKMSRGCDRTDTAIFTEATAYFTDVCGVNVIDTTEKCPLVGMTFVINNNYYYDDVFDDVRCIDITRGDFIRLYESYTKNANKVAEIFQAWNIAMNNHSVAVKLFADNTFELMKYCCWKIATANNISLPLNCDNVNVIAGTAISFSTLLRIFNECLDNAEKHTGFIEYKHSNCDLCKRCYYDDNGNRMCTVARPVSTDITIAELNRAYVSYTQKNGKLVSYHIPYEFNTCSKRRIKSSTKVKKVKAEIVKDTHTYVCVDNTAEEHNTPIMRMTVIDIL